MDIKIQELLQKSWQTCPSQESPFEILDVIEATIQGAQNWLQLHQKLLPSRSVDKIKIVIGKGGETIDKLSWDRR